MEKEILDNATVDFLKQFTHDRGIFSVR